MMGFFFNGVSFRFKYGHFLVSIFHKSRWKKPVVFEKMDPQILGCRFVDGARGPDSTISATNR